MHFNLNYYIFAVKKSISEVRKPDCQAAVSYIAGYKKSVLIALTNV